MKPYYILGVDLKKGKAFDIRASKREMNLYRSNPDYQFLVVFRIVPKNGEKTT